MLFQFFPPRSAFFLFCPQFGAGDQSAKILISGARLCDERITRRARFAKKSVLHRDLGADVSFELAFHCSQMKTWRTINAIAIEQSHGRHSVIGTSRDESFGQRSAFQKTECRAGVEFYVHLRKS